MVVQSPILGSFIFLFAVIVATLNVFTLFLLIKLKEYQHVSCYATINIVIVNILQALITIPSFGALQFDISNEANAVMCDIFSFTYFVFMHSVIFSLLLTTFEHVVSIAKPLKYRYIMRSEYILKYIFASWVFIILFDVIPFFNQTDYLRCHYIPRKQWSDTAHIVMSSIPMLVIVICWIYIIQVSLKQHRKLYPESVKRNAASIKVKTTKSTILIVSVYLLCYGTDSLYNMMYILCYTSCFPTDFEESHIHSSIRFASEVLILVFSFVTPIIFCCRKKLFREYAKSLKGKIKRVEFSSVFKFNEDVNAASTNV